MLRRLCEALSPTALPGVPPGAPAEGLFLRNEEVPTRIGSLVVSFGYTHSSPLRVCSSSGWVGLRPTHAAFYEDRYQFKASLNWPSFLNALQAKISTLGDYEYLLDHSFLHAFQLFRNSSSGVDLTDNASSHRSRTMRARGQLKAVYCFKSGPASQAVLASLCLHGSLLSLPCSGALEAPVSRLLLLRSGCPSVSRLRRSSPLRVEPL